MKQDRGVLEGNLAPILQHLSTNRNAVKTIQSDLAMYNILPGETQKYINDPDTLYQIEDSRALFLLSESIYRYTKNSSVDPEEYFTDQEIQNAKRYDENVFRNKDLFPFTLHNIVLGNGDFGGFIDVQDGNKLMDGRKINYNFDLQREPTKVKRYNSVMMVPTLNKKNVEEITDLLIKGQLVTSTIVLNAVLGTAKMGKELVYNEKNNTITIMPGTVLDVVDGYHRLKAIQNALVNNPNLQFKFQLLLTNTDVVGAKRYQAQFSKGQPLSEERKRVLNQPSIADKVVEMINTGSDLSGKISQQDKLGVSELVKASTLSKAIDNNFEITLTSDAKKVGDYLIDFFNTLIGKYPNELFKNIDENKKDSYVGFETMFTGYVILAGRMYKEQIAAEYIDVILDQINFSKTNPLWKNIIISYGLNKETERNIIKLFKNLEIS